MRKRQANKGEDESVPEWKNLKELKQLNAMQNPGLESG